MSTPQTETAKVIRGPGITPAPDRSIGAMLMDSGKITPDEAERVLRYAKDKNLRFGDAAQALRLVTAEDIQQVLARQFDYPYLAPGESNVSREVVAAWSPFSNQVEALRAVRSQLLLRWFTGDSDHRSLAIVSAAKGDGRSYLAANLAVVFSQITRCWWTPICAARRSTVCSVCRTPPACRRCCPTAPNSRSSSASPPSWTCRCCRLAPPRRIRWSFWAARNSPKPWRVSLRSTTW
jgi:hypothetical protein